jgi:hypothetical protein
MELPYDDSIDLATIIAKRWETQKLVFDRLRMFLDVIVHSDTGTNQNQDLRANNNSNELDEILLNAFHANYVNRHDDTNLPKRFMKTLINISKNWNPDKYLAPYTSLVQSSGYG